MKKHLLFVILALVVSATPLLAAEGTIGVYFTENGVDYSRYAQFAGNDGPLIYGHVILFVEDVVRGGSFMMTVDSPEVAVISEAYPPNVAIGSIMTGLDLGLNDPIFGFLGAPVELVTVTMINNVYPRVPNVNFDIVAAFSNAAPIYADGGAVVYPLVGLPAALGDTVDNENGSWSNVKALFR